MKISSQGSSRDDVAHDTPGDELDSEVENENASRTLHAWQQFRPSELCGENGPDGRLRDDEVQRHGFRGVRRHALTIVFRAR